jgi:hypothetical protein
VSSCAHAIIADGTVPVGQNIQARASDTRSQQTYNDAEAVLAEAIKIQEHTGQSLISMRTGAGSPTCRVMR